MNSTDKQKANRLTLAYRDMDDVKRYLSVYLELDALQKADNTARYFDHCEALLIAAVISYCRSFKRSKSHGDAATRLDPLSLPCLNKRADFYSLHNVLLDRRDSAIAHSDWKNHNTELVATRGSTVFRRVSTPDYAHGIDVPLFLELADAVSNDALDLGNAIDRRQVGGGAA